MPVQDTEDARKTSEPVADAEEELRKQQAAKQEHQQDETSVQKSGKLLPFLNAKAEHHQSRIDTLDSKIATQQDKIAKHQAVIDKLSEKADRLEDKNRMLEATLGNLPLVRKFIEANEKKIAEIRENKIPAREQKIKTCEGKIAQHTAKRERISHKLDRVVALNDAIKSFSIGFNKERREAFADALSRLNTATVDSLIDKKDALSSQRSELMQKFTSPETNSVDKLRLQDKINGFTQRIEELEGKIMKLSRPETHYAEQTNDELDASMKLTQDRLGEMVDNGTVTMPDMAEETLTVASKVETLDKSQVAALADQLGIEPLTSAEVQLEDDYNMIDGIINNGTKADLEQAKAELLVGIKSMEELADNPFVSAEMHDMAANNLSQMKEKLAAIDAGLGKISSLDEINADERLSENEAEVENWLISMVDQGKAELNDNGGFKVNPDYYKELPRNDRHIETMTEAQAVAVMTALSAAGIEFSAASKGEDKVGITVSKKDMVALNDIMYQSVGKTAKIVRDEERPESAKGKYQTVNPEYNASLPKDQKFTQAEPIETARSIAAELQKQSISFSAVVRKNDTVAITVSKENAQAFKQISAQVKGERARELVNPDFFKSLPKQERQTERMDEAQARKKSAELDKRGIEHSAVFDGEKSAVTVAKKDGKRAFFSRSKMQREVQRVSGKGQQKPPQQKDKNRNDQGLF